MSFSVATVPLVSEQIGAPPDYGCRDPKIATVPDNEEMPVASM
jgi:hypothetical protein